MQQLSVSFTLGKQSNPHGAHVAHNNRDFSAKNVEYSKTNNNIIYASESIEKAYDKLFSESLEAYNKEQRKSRRIENYYEHILNSKREEAFYEAIIQYGDKETAACGSQNGIQVSRMLTEYFEDFKKRNPNLYVFNAVQHLDEATPHLHIDFIPFYTQGRTNGLSKGVSLKAALIEEGFTPTNHMKNQVVAWEESERRAMEKIMNTHGFEKENKHANYAHMTVEEYKIFSADKDKLCKNLQKLTVVSEEEMTKENIASLRQKVSSLEAENYSLKTKVSSDFVPCYYSSPDKLGFVLTTLQAKNIPVHETETGFEIQRHNLELVRTIEKNYHPVMITYREKLSNDIDKLLLSVGSLDELYQQLQKMNYRVKTGKYVSVRPPDSERYIRIKSLGEFYSEQALKNRIASNRNTEIKFTETFKGLAGKDTLERMNVQSICIYFTHVRRGLIPMRKRNPQRPFSWTNDAELDKLTELNARLNKGATLDTFKQEFKNAEYEVNKLESDLANDKELLEYFTELKEKIEVVFAGKPASEDMKKVYIKELNSFEDFSINAKNYTAIYKLISEKQDSIKTIETNLNNKQGQLKIVADYYEFASKVAGGTYIQSLTLNEHIRKNADSIPHGITVSR